MQPFVTGGRVFSGISTKLLHAWPGQVNTLGWVTVFGGGISIQCLNKTSTGQLSLTSAGRETIIRQRAMMRPHGSLAICRPSGCTVVSGVVVVGGVCNRSQMRTSKCTCLIFGVSIGL